MIIGYQQMKAKLKNEYDVVLNSDLKGYNGAVDGKVNISRVQPSQREGRIPQYACSQLVEQQDTYDELERIGVLSVQRMQTFRLNMLAYPASSINQNGSFPLVTAFSEVEIYGTLQSSLMPDVDRALRHIAQ